MSDHPSTAKSIFLNALEIPSGEARQTYLVAQCGGNESLGGEVESLLRQHGELGSFLESPVTGQTLAMGVSSLSEGAGTVVGPNKLLQRIGEGGMGVVFMAEQQRPVQRMVAMKIIKPGMDTRQVIARFEAERQALALMDHPNIAKVLDAGATDTGRPYFVMELVKGVPITEYCDEHHLTPRERLDLFVPVCQAVQHAHQKGIIHRDLKPSNVMIALYDGRPVPKIIDFGVAKATGRKLTERTMFTEYGAVVGTVEYMSPEQAELNQLDIDTRSDIYSLGVLLYELLTSTTPFDKSRLRSAAFVEMLRIIREEDPPKPSTRLSTTKELATVAADRGLEPKKLSGAMRGELDWIVMKCLEKDRNRRYETANGLVRDIERYLCDEAVQACPPTRTYRLKKFLRRNKAAALTGTVVVVALTVGLILASIGFLQARRQAQIAAAEVAKATAISDLLQSALQSANPEQAKGSAYTVRELLDDIAADLGDKLADQPEVEIELRTTIGLAYRRLGMPGSAEPHFKRALELARHVYGPEHIKFADALMGYSQNLREQNRFADAETNIREALRIYRLGAISGRPLVDALWALEIVLVAENQDRDAEAVAREALAVAESDGTVYPEAASVLHKLSEIKVNQKEYAVAEDLARRAVEMHRRLHGNENLETAWGLTSLGSALAANAKYSEAEAAYREALAIFRRYYVGNHRSVVIASNGLTSALKGQAGLDALKRYEETLALRKAKLGPDHPDTLMSMNDLASSYSALGRHAEALKLYEETLALRKAKLGPDHPDTLVTMNMLADAYRRAGRYAEADPFSREALAIGLKKLSAEIPASDWQRLHERGELYARGGQWQKAAADYTAAIKAHPEDHALWYEAAAICLEAGDPDAYRRLCQEMLRRFGETNDPVIAERTAKICLLIPVASADLPPRVRLAERAVTGTEKHNYYRYFLLARAMAHYRAGEFDRAIALLDKSFAAGARFFDPKPAYLVLAMAHHQLGQREEAEKAMKKARALMEQKGIPQEGSGDYGSGWHDWVICQLLRREAETLIRGSEENGSAISTH